MNEYEEVELEKILEAIKKLNETASVHIGLSVRQKTKPIAFYYQAKAEVIFEIKDKNRYEITKTRWQL